MQAPIAMDRARALPGQEIHAATDIHTNATAPADPCAIEFGPNSSAHQGEGASHGSGNPPEGAS